jgi:hypothetical protein
MSFEESWQTKLFDEHSVCHKTAVALIFFRAVWGSQLNNQTTFSLSNPYQSSIVEMSAYTTFTVTMIYIFSSPFS